MTRDPLDVVARVQRLTVEAATRDLARRRQQDHLSEASLQAAATLISLEISAAAAPESTGIAVWLPTGLAKARQALSDRRECASKANAAAMDLAYARGREQTVARLLQDRLEARRRLEQQRYQAALDEMAQNRRNRR